MRKRIAAFVLIAPSLVGCMCGQRPLPTQAVVTPQESTLDFGQVFLNEKAQKSVTLTLDGFTATPLVLDADTVPPDYTVDLAAGATLAPGQRLKVTIDFIPTVLGPHGGDIVINAPDTQQHRVIIHVLGVGLKPAIQTDPQELDFGTVLIGTSKTLPMVVTNLIDTSQRVDMDSDEPDFTIDQPFLELGPALSSTINVTFTPTSRGTFDGPHLRFTLCPGCDPVTRVVKGTGVIEEFSLVPSPLDFGTHSPGSTTCQDEVIKNTGDLPIRFDSAVPDHAFSQEGIFDLQLGSLLDGSTTLDPKGTTKVKICFTPRKLATVYTGSIGFTTVKGDYASLKVVGRGGSAQIVCVPDQLDFGVTTPTAPITRQVVCKNLGEPEDVLLQTIGVDEQDTLRFDYAQDGDPMGFNVGRADFHFDVTFIATVPGDYAATITLDSARPGSPNEDQLQLPVSGTIVDGVPCTLSVQPAEVRFGLVQVQTTHTRDVEIANTSPTAACVVWGFGLDPVGDPDPSDEFSLSGAPDGIASIPAGGNLKLTVTYAPTEPSIETDVQTLSFKQLTGIGMDPTVKVPISGFATPLDLHLEPDPVEFGTVPIPYVKRLSVSLVSDNAHTIKVGGTMPPPNPAGDIAPSPDSSPAFSVDHLPGAFPFSVGAYGTMSFTAVFAPTSPGDYTGTLEVWLLNTPEPIIVPMHGIATNDPCGDLCIGSTAICPGAQSTWVSAAVTLNGAGYDQQGGPVTCHWDVLTAPALSTAVPDQPDECVTSFRPDVEGKYTFKLTVKNGRGYTDTCQTEVQAKTFLGLWIETTWSAPDDVDLHLFHPLAGDVLNANTWFNLPYDCYYSNQNPYWDTTGRADDPSLDRDDETGTGPEDIRIDAPSTQHSYEIGVHWFASRNRNRSLTVTTRVFCAGKEKAELTNVLSRQYMAADVGTVTWNPDNTCEVTKGHNFTLTVIP